MPGTTQALSKTMLDTTQALSSYLWTAFIGTEADHAVLVCSSSDGGTSWTGNTATGQTSPLAASLAFFNGRLYAAFIAANGTGNVLVSSSSDGVNWTSYTNTGHSSSAAPSLAVYNGQLYCAYVGADDTNVYVTSSSDGATWTAHTPTGQLSATGPSLAVYNGQLYAAFIADNGTGNVLVSSSRDGVNWTGNTNTGQSSPFAPSLAFFNGQLYAAFIAENGTGDVLVSSSEDGVSWTGNTNTGQSSATAPSLAACCGRLYVAFIADNGTGNVLVSSSGDGATWPGNTAIGQSSPFAPSLAAPPTPLYLETVVDSAMLNVGDASLYNLSHRVVISQGQNGALDASSTEQGSRGVISPPCSNPVTVTVTITGNWNGGSNSVGSWSSQDLQASFADAALAAMQALGKPYENYSYTQAFTGTEGGDVCVDPQPISGYYIPAGILITAYNNAPENTGTQGQVTVTYSTGDQSGGSACDTITELNGVLAIFPPTSEFAAIVGAFTNIACGIFGG